MTGINEKAVEAALRKQFNKRLRGPDGGVSIFKDELPKIAQEVASDLADAPHMEMAGDIEQVIEIVAAWTTSEEGPPNDVTDSIDDFIRLARRLRTRDRRGALRLT